MMPAEATEATEAVTEAAQQADVQETRALPRRERLRVAAEVAAVVGLHGVVGVLRTQDGVSRLAHHRAARPIVNRHGRGAAYHCRRVARGDYRAAIVSAPV